MTPVLIPGDPVEGGFGEVDVERNCSPFGFRGGHAVPAAQVLTWIIGVCCEQSLIRSQPWQVGASSSCLSCAVPGDGTLSDSHFSCAGEFAGTGFSECWLRQLTVPAVGAIVGGARVRRWGYGESPCSLATFSPTKASAGEKENWESSSTRPKA